MQAPLLEGCVGWIECGVHDAYRSATTRSSSARWSPRRPRRTPSTTPGCSPIPEERPLHYLGVNYYAILGERLEARIPAAADIKRDVEAGQVDLADEQEAAERREREEIQQDREQRG